MPFQPEYNDAPHRPKKRRLRTLTNDELCQLFEMRAKAVADKLRGHIFWESNRIVYWSAFSNLQARLYEVMMEIQSRYPEKEYFDPLPVAEAKIK